MKRKQDPWQTLDFVLAWILGEPCLKVRQTFHFLVGRGISTYFSPWQPPTGIAITRRGDWHFDWIGQTFFELRNGWVPLVQRVNPCN